MCNYGVCSEEHGDRHVYGKHPEIEPFAIMLWFGYGFSALLFSFPLCAPCSCVPHNDCLGLGAKSAHSALIINLHNLAQVCAVGAESASRFANASLMVECIAGLLLWNRGCYFLVSRGRTVMNTKRGSWEQKKTRVCKPPLYNNYDSMCAIWFIDI